MALKYIGNGAFVHGIPARDLSDEEVRDLGGEARLIATGHYIKVESEKLKAQSGKTTRAAVDDRSVGTGWDPHKEGE